MTYVGSKECSSTIRMSYLENQSVQNWCTFPFTEDRDNKLFRLRGCVKSKGWNFSFRAHQMPRWLKKFPLESLLA